MGNTSTKAKFIRYFSIFVEDILLILTVIALIFMFWLSFFLKDSYQIFEKLNAFFINDLGHYLVYEDGSIITVATVFIGIYFSIYTMLTSIQTDSVLSNLGKKNFKKLLNILGTGFLSSFLYTLYSIFFQKSFETSKELTSFFVLLLLIIFMTSALQFGIIIYIILKIDISTTIIELADRRLEAEKQQRIMLKLEEYLVREQNKLDLEKAEEVSRILSEKNKSK